MSNRKIDRLSHLKSDSSQIKKGFPSKQEGIEGKIELRHIPGYGLALFAFSSGNWYISRMELQKASKIDKKLTVDTLQVKKALDLDNNEIKNLNPEKIKGAKKWNDAHKNLTSGKYKAKFESVQIGDARVSIDKDNLVSFSNIRDGNDVEIKTRRVRFDKDESESSPSIDVAEGDLHYDSSTKAIYASSGGIWANAVNNFSSGQTSQLLLMAKNADSFVKFSDNVTNKWVVGYDKHGATTFTDATCDTTSGSQTITFDGSGTADSGAVAGMLVSGTGIPTGSVVSTKSSGSMTISEAATATNTNTTLTFAENDGKFKINTGGSLADPSLFELDTSGNLTLAGGITSSGSLTNTNLIATSTSASQLKLAYDTNHFVTFTVSANGDMEVQGSDSGTTKTVLKLKNAGLANDQYLVWGSGSEQARITSNGAQNLLLNTNQGTNSGYIEINDGANNDIHIAPNGTGLVILGTDTGSVQFATNSFLDANGNPLFGTAVASSAVNNVELGNAATGDPAILKATGTDTNVPLTITTKGTGAVTVDSGGDISLDSASGNFVYKNAGTEFSVENSAFAGTILAYRCIGESTAHTSYTLTSSFAVPNGLMTARFVAPPSGVVEYEVQAYVDVYSNYLLYFGLSDASTYNSLGNSYEQLVHKPDETDQSLVTWKVIESGLTAGTTYNRWFGAKVSSTTYASKIFYAGTAANRYADFIFKVTALPHAKAAYAVYG